ncbi:MAG: 30S ribosomal protein S6 [Calothrix sp. MO_167.B12]|nr:30S ribosomal protein S6 [Calothrix sp. MO_167.B12]
MSVFYETMYILRPDLGEEQVGVAIAKYENMIRESGASDIEIQNRGKRRLAYEINRHRDGIYIQMNYTGPGKVIAPMERAMRLSEEVIRYLTIKQEQPQAATESEETETATPV